jgi:ferredoxin-NADP reductase
MAVSFKARVVRAEPWNDDTAYVHCEMIEPAELGFVGGQYIIVNSGKALPNGKPGKRAYSIPSSDVEQRCFDLVVKRIPQGVGSNFVWDLKEGDTFEFSGPWGKYYCSGEAEGETLCVSTDTGITAALGLLRGKRWPKALRQTRFLWLTGSHDYFIPVSIVKAWLPGAVDARFPVIIPPVGTEARIAAAVKEVESRVAGATFSKIYLSGDGLILRELKEFFLTLGYTEDRVVVETFFNHASLKTANAA